jgi:hypothetical protein
MGNYRWHFLESRAEVISVFYSLMTWTISLFAQPLTLISFKFSRWRNLPDSYQFPKVRLVIRSSPGLLPSIHLTQLYQTYSLAPTTTLTLPRIKFVVFPVLIMMPLKHLIHTRLKYLSMVRSCHGSSRTNRYFDLIASDISSFKSLSADFLCLLRHFSIGYFKPAEQNSYWHRINNYHSGWNDHSWILYSKPGYYSVDSSWLIAFIVNHHNLIWSMR